METLKTSFRKNGIDYNLIDRAEITVLFELKINRELAGYEVCKIHFRKAGVFKGKSYPESEVLPSNEQFGFDGSKTFFTHDSELAKEYCKKFEVELSSKQKTIIEA